MIISDRFRFVFVHNPKCGGTVFRNSVHFAHDYPTTFWEIRMHLCGRLLDYAHLRLWEIKELFPDVYARLQSCTSFVFVRDPMHRFISALHHHFREYRKSVAVDNLGWDEKLALFRSFARSELSQASVIDDPRHVHFSPQKWFCTVGDNQIVKHILPFEDQPMEAAQTLLGVSLPTGNWRAESRANAALLMDPILADFVGRFYAEDYAFFSTLPHLRFPSWETVFADDAAEAA